MKRRSVFIWFLAFERERRHSIWSNLYFQNPFDKKARGCFTHCGKNIFWKQMRLLLQLIKQAYYQRLSTFTSCSMWDGALFLLFLSRSKGIPLSMENKKETEVTTGGETLKVGENENVRHTTLHTAVCVNSCE